MLQKRRELLKAVLKKDGFFGLLNLGMRFVDGKLKPEQVHFFPTAMQVELTTACNLRCEMCEHSHLKQNPVSMSFTDFKSLIDNAPFVELVNLTGIGEVLLNPDWFKIMQYAKRKGLYVWFNDNFTLMDKKNAEKVIELGVDAVAISLDGATKKAFERIRRGASFEKVKKNIRDFVELRKELGKKKPELFIVFVAMKENLHEMKKMPALAKNLGIARILFVGVITFFGTEQKSLRGTKRKELEKEFEETQKKAAESGIEIMGMPELQGSTAAECPFPWVSSYITSSGDVLPCCYIKQRSHNIERAASMGNIKEKSFKEIWKGASYKELRKAFKTGNLPGYCRLCFKMKGS